MTKRRPVTGNKSPGSKTPDDRELWAQVTASVKPLKNRNRIREQSGVMSSPPCAPERKRPGKPPPAVGTPSRPVTASAAVKRAPAVHHAPQLSGLDRRTSQKLARGNADIEARIDLHGMTRQNARATLASFLAASRSSGQRTVLVITGKGRSPYSSHTLHGYQQVDMPEREGVLRRALPQWLDETEFRVHVAGYQPAHPKHGGGGAFYIRLRKPKG